MTNSTVAKRTGVSSWKHLIDVHLNFTFEYDKNIVEGRVFLITAVIYFKQTENKGENIKQQQQKKMIKRKESTREMLQC